MAKKEKIIKREVDYRKGRPLTLAHRGKLERGWDSPGAKGQSCVFYRGLDLWGVRCPFASHRNSFSPPVLALHKGAWILWGFGLGVSFFFLSDCTVRSNQCVSKFEVVPLVKMTFEISDNSQVLKLSGMNCFKWAHLEWTPFSLWNFFLLLGKLECMRTQGRSLSSFVCVKDGQ